jgi:hypothetical protein
MYPLHNGSNEQNHPSEYPRKEVDSERKISKTRRKQMLQGTCQIGLDITPHQNWNGQEKTFSAATKDRFSCRAENRGNHATQMKPLATEHGRSVMMLNPGCPGPSIANPRSEGENQASCPKLPEPSGVACHDINHANNIQLVQYCRLYSH